MRSNKLSAIALCALGLLGCQADGKAEGQATFARPANEGGEPVPRQENRADFELTVELSGAGAWDLVEGLACTLTSGDLSGSVSTEARVRSDGSYVTTFATAEGSFSSPSDILCDNLQGVQLESVTSVTVRGALPANEENCQAFCEAKAQADCEGDLNEAQCLVDVAAECQADCSSSQRIVANGSISAEALGSLNNELGASGKLEAEVDLVFTDLE